MQAIIMAGGAGQRLRPLTNDMPKPMVKIIDKPILEIIIERLKKYDIYDIGLTLNYKAEIIKNYFGDGSAFGVKLRYFFEDKPLGTAGGIKQAEKYLDNNFLVLSGDSLNFINYDKLFSRHFEKNKLATIAVKEVENVQGFGVVKVENDIVKSFIEKPTFTTEKLVNTGIYCFKHDILNFIPNDFYDFGRDLFPKIIGDIASYETNDYWSDIGTLKSYYEANLYMVNNNFYQ